MALEEGAGRQRNRCEGRREGSGPEKDAQRAMLVVVVSAAVVLMVATMVVVAAMVAMAVVVNRQAGLVPNARQAGLMGDAQQVGREQQGGHQGAAVCFEEARQSWWEAVHGLLSRLWLARRQWAGFEVARAAKDR